jgi:eukaryotic-like serine/threonine-protein kinase
VDGRARAAPLVLLSCLIQREAADFAWQETLLVAQFSAVTIVVSVWTSRRIYGLARRVEAAQRFGQYVLEEKLGEGGMGEVYRARHVLLPRATAIKLLPKDRSAEEDVARFAREVKLTSQLCHPNTIQIYDYGRADDGTFYYAMEYLDGLTLDELVERYGAQPAGRVARIIADVCGSLSEAHTAGLVHRDIKPQNVMLCARGGLLDVVKVLDFGLVRSLHGGSPHSVEHMIVGTPAYMSPEAITSASRVDARSDLYAVGALAYYLLSGSQVFYGDNVLAIISQHLSDVPEPLSRRTARAIPAAFELLVHACLSKAAEQRPASAGVMRKELLALADAEPGVDLEQWWAAYVKPPRGSATSEARTLQAATRSLSTW